MISKHYVCANCSTQNYFDVSKTVYRCGDAYVCSKKCADLRLEEIMTFDPLLSNSLLWKPHDNISTETNKTNETKNTNINTNTTYLSTTTNDITNAYEKENKYVERLNNKLEKNIEYYQKIYHDVEKKNDNNTHDKNIIVDKNDDNKPNIIKQRNTVFCNACFKVFGLCLAGIIMFTSLLNHAH